MGKYDNECLNFFLMLLSVSAMPANVFGLALLGYLKIVSPQLKSHIVLKVEDNNKS